MCVCLHHFSILKRSGAWAKLWNINSEVLVLARFATFQPCGMALVDVWSLYPQGQNKLGCCFQLPPPPPRASPCFVYPPVVQCLKKCSIKEIKHFSTWFLSCKNGHNLSNVALGLC